MVDYTHRIQGYADDYEDLLEMALNIPLAHKKNLAEYLLHDLEENGYNCKWEAPNLTARKVEEL